MNKFGRNMLWMVSIFMISWFARASNVCDSSCHCLEIDFDLVIVNCKGYVGHLPQIDYELVEWPKSKDRFIQAYFNNMSILYLPQISGDLKVKSLNFDDNLIRTISPNPFQYFPNLEKLSVANNFITDLTKDFLKTNYHLKSLNLANNSLSTIQPAVLAHLKELYEIDFSFNGFTKLSSDFMEAISSVEILQLENNKIFTLDNAYKHVEYKFRQMFLANNHFTIITAAMFETFRNLESIDLSNNKITNIDEKAFLSLELLKLLDLSNNAIRTVFIKLPNTLELLTMASNQLVTWPLANTPHNLSVLELQNNNLEKIFPKDHEVDSLKILIVSNNQIDHLPNTVFIQLDSLDLSHNYFRSVPQNLNEVAPMLSELILDGNEIEIIEFVEKITLSSISFNYMPTLRTIQSNAFSNLEGIRLRNDGSGNCVDISMSHNSLLNEIDEDAFKGVEICSIDLSYNQLVIIPRNLTDWTKIEDGIDIQGNPWMCSCDDQWMLDVILEKLYNNAYHQYLLMDLSCQSPSQLRGKRFVQFLGHENPFCNLIDEKKLEKIVQKSSFGSIFVDQSENDKKIQLELTHGPGFVIVVAMCVIILFAMVGVGIYWQRQQDRKLALRNRIYDYDY